MDDLLTTKEIKTAMGLTENDATAAYIHGLSDFMAVCKAQSAKTKAALVAEGWKSPAEVAKARQGWLYEGRMAEREKMKRFIAQARADERDRIVGLFDEAAKTIDDETDYEAYAYDARVEAKLLESATRIIEGLRENK
jgi:hypothetical protein